MTTNKNSVLHMAARALGFLAVLIAGLGIPLASQAQDDPVVSQAEEEGGPQANKEKKAEKKEDQTAGIQEVVVTTRRMEEKLKEVPLSITAFDSQSIENSGISSLADVAALTPGLSFFNPLGEALPVPVIRGIVPQDIFGVNAAAVFIDGVYVAGREGLNFSQLDLERIEVVKGPQSAMYGRNAFSGAINYVTKKPGNDFEAKSEAEAGNRGKQRIQGSLSGPLVGDTLFGRVSGLYDEWDGSYDNTEDYGNDIGGYRYRSFQGGLRWVPADTLEINTGLYYSNDRIDESATAALPANCEDQVETTLDHANNEPHPRLQNVCGEVPGLASLPDALDPDNYPNALPGSVTRDSMPKVSEADGENRELLRGNLNIEWDVGFGTLDFLTGYSSTEQSSVGDFNRSTGNGIPFLYCQGGGTQTAFAPANCQVSPEPLAFLRTPMGFVDEEHGSTVEEISQEIRFSSPSDKSLRYTGGFYYFNDHSKGYPGGLIATAPLPAPLADIGLGAVPGGTRLAIGSYIFGPGFMPEGAPDGTIDPLNRVTGEGETQSWSVFGAVDYDLTEAWQARAEIRYAEERQESTTYTHSNYCTNPLYYQGNGQDPGPRPDPSDPDFDKWVALANAAIVTANPYNPAQNFPYNQPDPACGNSYWDLRTPDQGWELAKDADGVYIPGQFTPATSARTGSARFDTLTGRLGLKYQFESGWMAYGSIAWGQKPGGLQLLSATVITDTGTERELFTNTFDPEKITAYELGIKGFTADQRIGVDLAMFYNDWTDIVLRQLTETSPASGRPFEQPVSLNVNAGNADVWGWEITTDFAFTDNLRGRLTGSWTDSVLTNARQDSFSLFPSFYTTEPSCAPAVIQSITGVDAEETAALQETKALQCQALSGDVSGNTQMRQPEWTASASLRYEHSFRGDWTWFAGGDASYTGKIYVGNDNQSWLPAHTLANLRFGFQSPVYTVEFWVRNVFDNDDPSAAFRDIYWTNTSDITASEPVPTHSNFDDFPPLRYSISYPKLRTFGVLARMRFGAAVK